MHNAEKKKTESIVPVLGHRRRVSPGLDGEGLIEELLVEVLLDIVDQDDRLALVVKLRPAGPAHHLQHIWRETDDRGITRH